MRRLKFIKWILCSILVFAVTSCNTKSDNANSIPHGYNNLSENVDTSSFVISKFDTDSSNINNIRRPKSTIIQSQIDTALLFGIWTTDPEGPHADFDLTKKSFYVVDYDGDGDMPYILNDDKLSIFYKDFVQEGKLISVSKDTLKILWKDFNETTNFVRWKQE